MTHNPTGPQIQALILLSEGDLHRWDGGWWALKNEPSALSKDDGYRVPERNTTVHTLRALERRGFVKEVPLTDIPSWARPRTLTEKGRELLDIALQKKAPA